MRCAIATLLLVVALAAPARPDPAPSAARGPSASSLRVPLLPFAWIGSRTRALVRQHESAQASPLERARGWTVLELAVAEPARTLYLEVDGRVQFDSAEIVFEEGGSRWLDLRGVVRGQGLFELLDGAGERVVTTVRLNARAASERASVGVRIARVDPPRRAG
jgi:hypothetical protein